jgi:hypothetical protein
VVNVQLSVFFALMLRARVLAVLGKDLGQESQKEDAYQDGHIGNQHGGIGSHCRLNVQL